MPLPPGEANREPTAPVAGTDLTSCVGKVVADVGGPFETDRAFQTLRIVFTDGSALEMTAHHCCCGTMEAELGTANAEPTSEPSTPEAKQK